MRRCALAVVTVMLALAAPAAADHSVLDLVSTAPGAQPCPAGVTCHASLVGSSADGRHALIRTKQPLVASDSNDTDDVYEWHDGVIRRIDQGLTTARISEDGSRIVFTSTAALVPEDTDGTFADSYELTGNTLRLISAPPGGSSAPNSASAIAITVDNSKVFFSTTEALDPMDTDVTGDIYEREGNTIRLVSAGLEIGAATHAYEGASDDGDHVFFATSAGMVPEDTDSSTDFYERTGGETRLVTTGPQMQDDGFFFNFPDCCYLSADGTDVAFSTMESLVPEDGDDFTCIDDMEETVPCSDVYLRSGGTTTLISGSGGCNDVFFGNCNAYVVAISDDGSQIVFASRVSHVPEDPTGWDAYEWGNGVITLLSVGPNGQANDSSSGFADQVFASADGRHVFFVTRTALTGDDQNGSVPDVYERFDGTTRLLSPQLPGGLVCCGDPSVVGVADDGSSVFVSTLHKYVPEDTNNAVDLYELNASGATLLTTGPSGQGGNLALGATTGLAEQPFGRSVSTDGSRVFLSTQSQLVPYDTDNETDIYLRRRPTTTGYPRAQGATPFRVPLVPAARQCLAPNRQHGPPFAFGSCNPPQPGSPNLTVGVGDGSPAFAQSEGRVRLDVQVGTPGGPDDSDVNIAFALTNVMNLPSLSDYTGELRATANVRLTDRVAGVPSTTGLAFGFTVPCTTTASTTLGGDCRVFTSVDAVVPGAAAEGTRAIWGLDQWRVSDGGSDGDAETAGDNSLLAVQGVFVP